MVRHRFFTINHFERQTLSNTPGIDGHLNGTPVNAKNISKDALIDFASNGPLVDIPNQGFIKNIYVQTADGWILIN